MRVLYFAEIKEILEMNSEDIDLIEDITVETFKELLFECHPSIRDKKFQIAVNEEFVQLNDIVKQDDIVALIPPVSGG
ncbi:molybdopterin converting factor subunit 1 [Staphylococcus hominis subsp. hominis]|uniref:molybdopterin converting factor subunit 1 n=1 Tax=Staphylococcus hominis TaxID=1290 RepID=UPI000B3B3300|nr:molybdopterin converting factor subunit 1 [Staphylococcus hominis]AUJ53093.1 molybdopterin converting factor subunit 1 [Staphylococcus hominis subsp. hominis]OUL47207.1 molybdopterin converting factor subunit 1 [Staphylococcus hominis subsp. hominis]